jgi:glycosyltransferase involved in cell wall biosynthesis
MINGRRIAVVLPAYNAENTLEATVREFPELVDIRILVDDRSSDRTIEVASNWLEVFPARRKLRLRT